MSDNELGAFLRARRELVTPADVGLPAGQRRRTPGLRRSEVATLAGVSVEYVTRLEQGHDRRPSAQVLSALAGVLRLTASERIHLYQLTKVADRGFTCRGETAPGRVVRPTVRALLDRLEPTPAALLDRAGTVVASTAGFTRLAGPVGLLDRDPPNLVRFVFTDRRARTVFPDWDRVADEQVSGLKQGPFCVDPLIDELTVTAGAAFTERIETVAAPPIRNGFLRLVHPFAGELRLAYETLELSADDDQRLVVYLAADDTTAAALRTLEHTGLRVVAG